MTPPLHSAITTWLDPLRDVLDPAGRMDWDRLTTFGHGLDDACRRYPVGPELPPGPQRSEHLRAIRAAVARSHLLDTSNQPVLFAVFAQFLCGYRDIDLRDTPGLGHGALIASYGTDTARQRWIPRLLDGQIAGIAITEPHGGSNPAGTHTCATATPNGTLLVTGRKIWISRLKEAAVFLVFFRDPIGELAAGIIDASAAELRRKVIAPAGLAGWTWGILDFDNVPMRRENLLLGNGMTLLRNHFANYRPLITATALGAAACMFDTAAEILIRRKINGEIAGVRDTALVTLGRTHTQLATGLLGTMLSAHLARTKHPCAEGWSAETKAHGVDIATQAAGELTVLLGATGFRADCQPAKIRRDLAGLAYADGIHDSLYRAAGKLHLWPAQNTDLARVVVG